MLVNRFFVAVFAALVISFSSNPVSAANHPPLRMEDFAPFSKPGDGVISGVVETSSVLGRRRFSHVRVYAVPRNAYTEWMTDVFRDDWLQAGRTNGDPAVGKFVFSGVSDDVGAFRISGLPSGSYIVYTFTNQVNADVKPGIALISGFDTQGQPASARVPELAYTNLVRDARFLEVGVVVALGANPVVLFSAGSGRGGSLTVSPESDAVLALVSPTVAPAISPVAIASFASESDGSIAGRLITRLPGMREPDVFRNATVSLWPVLPYTFWLVDDVRRAWTPGAIRRVGPGNPLFLKAVRSVQTDGDGRYTFSQVPAGDYVVVSGLSYFGQRQGGTYYTVDTNSQTVDRFGYPFARPSQILKTPELATYTCRSSGIVMSYVTAKPGFSSNVPLAVLSSRNEGC